MKKPNSDLNRPVMRKPVNVKSTLKRIFGYFSGYKTALIFVLIGIVLNAISNVIGTYMLKPVINNGIVPLIGQSDPDFTVLIQTLSIMGIVYAIGALAGYMYARIMVNVSTGVLFRLRTEMFTKMQRLPIQFFDTHTHGEIMSRYTNDTDAMRELLSQSIPQTVSSAIRIVSVFIMMLILSPLLTLIAIVMLAVMTLFVTKLGKKSGAYFKERQRSLGKVNGFIEEMTEGQKVVKVFCHENETKQNFSILNEELFKNSAAANTLANMLMPIMNNLSHLNYAVTAAAGGLMGISGMLDVGAIASFLQYSRNFSMPITQLSQQFTSILSALAGAERIFEIIDQPFEADDGYITIVNVKSENNTLIPCDERTGMWAWKHPDGTLTEVRGDVRFTDVTFSYDGKKIVLDNVSLYAHPGQKIAFVGSTGAGKTTITNLINRFYDIEQGEITYDGIPIKRIKKDDLRRSLAMVLQDTHLFTETVRENIRYGRPNATDDEVVAAAKLANAHYFISHLPQGYDTVLTADGANLSQGQRQLLAIARAAVADPPVLILDEATSSIDTRTEAQIERGMDELMRGRTVFVIAHRLSTVRNSNAILVLENGRIIERGDHDDLLAQNGKYYSLYMGLFELS